MPRFFKEFFSEQPFLDGEDARHIANSLRMRPGENVTVCDTRGFDYRCRIVSCGPERVELEIIEKTAGVTEPTVFVTLYQCLPKGDKMDAVVRQAVELGVSRTVPVLSSNCVSRPDGGSLARKLERWRKIAAEAAGQCGRGIIPEVGGCLTLSEAARAAGKDDRCYFCYELGGDPIGEIPETVKTVSVIIGPEGGFTAEEAETLASFGAMPTTLGPRILRTETAPIAAVAAVMLRSGNMK